MELIYRKIREQILLSYPDYSNPFHIDTDAWRNGIGAVLYQKSNVLGFYSSKFSQTQTRYTIPEKECLAVISALNHFKTIVYGAPVIVHTDHVNLLSISSNQSIRMQR